MPTYRNPAAAVGQCRREGASSASELYQCAVEKMPAASERWRKEARRLAANQLGAAKRRRARRQFDGVRTFKRVKRRRRR